MMPQKLNPDVAELARGKAGAAIGRLDRPARNRQGASARVQPRPAGGQGAGLQGAARFRGTLAALECSSAASNSTTSGSPPRAAIRWCQRLTLRKRCVAEGIPFRDAHEHVAVQVRDGTFGAPDCRARVSRRARPTCTRRSRKRARASTPELRPVHVLSRESCPKSARSFAASSGSPRGDAFPRMRGARPMRRERTRAVHRRRSQAPPPTTQPVHRAGA